MTVPMLLQLFRGFSVNLIGSVSPPPGFVSPSGVTERIAAAIQIALVISAAVAVVFIIINGLQMITASGDPNKIKSAQQGIQWAVIGLIVCLMANVILLLVSNAFGFTPDFGSLNN